MRLSHIAQICSSAFYALARCTEEELARLGLEPDDCRRRARRLRSALRRWADISPSTRSRVRNEIYEAYTLLLEIDEAPLCAAVWSATAGAGGTEQLEELYLRMALYYLRRSFTQSYGVLCAPCEETGQTVAGRDLVTDCKEVLRWLAHPDNRLDATDAVIADVEQLLEQVAEAMDLQAGDFDTVGEDFDAEIFKALLEAAAEEDEGSAPAAYLEEFLSAADVRRIQKRLHESWTAYRRAHRRLHGR